jgi:hypothetical protein
MPNVKPGSVRVERIELSASVLSGQRSTTELHTHFTRQLYQEKPYFANKKLPDRVGSFFRHKRFICCLGNRLHHLVGALPLDELR